MTTNTLFITTEESSTDRMFFYFNQLKQ